MPGCLRLSHDSVLRCCLLPSPTPPTPAPKVRLMLVNIRVTPRLRPLPSSPLPSSRTSLFSTVILGEAAVPRPQWPLFPGHDRHHIGTPRNGHRKRPPPQHRLVLIVTTGGRGIGVPFSRPIHRLYRWRQQQWQWQLRRWGRFLQQR